MTSRRNLEQFILSCPDNSGTGHFLSLRKGNVLVYPFWTTCETVFPIQEFFQQTNWFRSRIQSVPRSLQENLNHCLAFLAPANTVHFAFVLLHNPEKFITLVTTIFSNTHFISVKILSQTETKFCESVLAQKFVSLPTKWQQDVHCMFFQLRLSGRYVGASQCRAQGDAWLTNGTTWSTSRRLHKREWQTGDIPHISSFSNIAPAALRPIPFDDNLLLDLKQTLSIKDHHRSLVIFNPCVREERK